MDCRALCGDEEENFSAVGNQYQAILLITSLFTDGDQRWVYLTVNQL
jgi:hypothetical protein